VTRVRCGLLSAAILASAPAAHAALDERAALRESQAAIGREIGDYRLRDSEGRTVRLAEFRGKPLVVSFIYTGCFQVCPTTTRALAQAVREAERTLGRGAFNVATIGFNLPFDTPQAMKDFARKYAVSAPNWRFLTPEADTLPQLVADFGFRYEATAAGFDHLLQASIVDERGRIYRQLYGDSFGGPRFVGPLLELAQNAPKNASFFISAMEEIAITRMPKASVRMASVPGRSSSAIETTVASSLSRSSSYFS